MKILLIIVAIITVSSCKILWVPASDPTILALKQSAKSSDSSFVASMLSSSDKSYNTYAAGYGQELSNDNGIFLQDSARKKSGILKIQDQQVIKILTAMQAQHQAKGVLTNGEIKVYLDLINNAWDADIVSEKSY